jgi:hypothetical protein
MRKIFLLLGLIGMTTHAFSNEEDVVRNANLTISAFSCSVFNDYIGNTEESKRLFDLGYRSGVNFYTHAANNEINNKTLNNKIPFLYLMVGGPNIDFKLGQVFSYVSDLATKKISQDSNLNFVYDEELRQIKAQNLVRENNCNLLKN